VKSFPYKTQQHRTLVKDTAGNETRQGTDKFNTDSQYNFLRIPILIKPCPDLLFEQSI
jgi:hypothetical protein